jgi:hypothetical protein
MGLSAKLMNAAKKVEGSAVVHCYDQTDDKRLQELDLTERGWCHAMCIEWLRDKRRHGCESTQFWDWVRDNGPQRSSEFARRMRFLMAEQAVRVSRGGLDQQSRASSPLRPSGLLSTGVEEWVIWYPNDFVTSANKVAMEIQRHRGDFLYIRLNILSNPPVVHVVAAVRNTTKLWYFDPLVGEICMNRDALERWLKWLFGTRYKASAGMNQCLVESFHGGN